MNCLKNVALKRASIRMKYLIDSKYSSVASEGSIRTSSIDSSEIDHHAELKSQWWNEKGTMKALHALNKLRVPFVRDGLLNTCDRFKINIDTSLPLKDANVLEVGCGGGILSEPLARIGANTTGLDASEELINLAMEHASTNPLNNLKYVCDSIENFSENNLEKFDAIVTSEVIEHVTEKDLFLNSCVRALRPGGSLFITTINKTRLSWITGILIAEQILQIVPKGTHHWDKFISPEDLSRLLDKYNCKVKLLHGMAYILLNNEWCWISNTSVNYAVQYIKQS